MGDDGLADLSKPAERRNTGNVAWSQIEKLLKLESVH